MSVLVIVLLLLLILVVVVLLRGVWIVVLHIAVLVVVVVLLLFLLHLLRRLLVVLVVGLFLLVPCVLVLGRLSCLRFFPSFTLQELFVEAGFSRGCLGNRLLHILLIVLVLRDARLVKHLLGHRTALSCAEWLFFLFVGIFLAHFHGFASALGLFFFLGSIKNRSQIGFPLGPVAIDELGHVLWLFIWVLQVDVGGLRGALVRVPVLGNPPRFS